MKFLKEYAEFEYEVLKEEKSIGPNNLVVKGVIQRADTLNQNGRIYPKDILFKEIENYKKVVTERRATGELDHCLLGTTEVLTQTGWKRLDEISEHESVYSYNMESGIIELQEIIRTIKKEYTGTMYRLSNGKKMDITMTPRHKVLLWNRQSKPYYLTAKELHKQLREKNSKLAHSTIRSTGEWNGKQVEEYRIPGTSYVVPAMAFAGMFGLWLAEGFADRLKHPDEKGHKSYRIQITQKKKENFQPIRELLKETRLPWREQIRNDGTIDWIISDKKLHGFFSQFGKAHEKYIPVEMLGWSTPLLNEIHKWLLIGDGRNRSSNVTGRKILELSTVSKKLADNVAELQFKLGYRPFIKTFKATKNISINGQIVESKNCKQLYTVSANVSKTTLDPRYVKIEEIDYKGNVYCLTVPNGNFLIRSNDYVCWTGNSDDPVVNLKHVSHLITDIWTDGGVVYGKIEILPTPMGNIAKSLIESNVKIGISSRALGSVRSRGDADVVQDDLHLICWDLVSEPSTPGAFMMKEARDVDPRILNKIFSRNDRISRVLNEILYFKKEK